MVRLLTRVTVWLAALAPTFALGQGFLVVIDPNHPVRLPRPIIIYPHPLPLPPESYKIGELELHARLIDQIAQVQVTQSFVNTGSRQLEACFIFPLPYDGAVEQMTFLVDGKEYAAKLLKADEARRIYEDIVRKNRDPALLEWIGTGLFKTSVFPVPPGAKRTVSLRYSQLCRKSEGLTDFIFPMSTAKYTSHPVERVAMRVTIESQEEIKNVYSPTHSVEIKRPDERHATITYESKYEVPNNDFRLLYDVGQGKVSTRVVSYRPQTDQDGYFLLLASPKIKPASEKEVRKTVVFVIDRSGSMSGKKIEQVQAALKFVLNNLRPGDLFNIVAYDNQVETFRPELQRFDDKTRKAAQGFVEGLYAGGSTDIDAALRTTFAQLQDSQQPSYIVFLTDGLPTTGETNEARIVANAKRENKVHARLFTFGVGYDVNSRLLDRLVREEFGQSQYVRPDEDIEEHVSRLFRRIQSPVMTGVQIAITVDKPQDDESRAVNRVYPKGTFDLFAGEQLVVVGRYKTPGRAKVVVSGTVGGKPQKFDFPADLVRRSGDDSYAFVEKLWAVRRVGEILDEIDLNGKNSELIQELVELSTRHGILTPYTSFLADETTRIGDVTTNAGHARRRLEALNESSGYSGVYQRSMKGAMQNAPQAASPAMGGMGGGMGGAYGNAFQSRGAGPLPALAAPGGGQRSSQVYGRSDPTHATTYSLADKAEGEAQAAQQNVRNVGNRAFYRRNGQWIDSTLAKGQESKAIHVKQFSDRYFELARQHGRQLSQYMVFDEPVMLNIEGQSYLIEP